MDELKIKIGKWETIIVLVILVLLFFFILFRISGLRTILGTILLFFVPIFIILNNFNLGLDEKIIFSFFIGLGFFSTLTYWLGFLVGSLKISMIIVFFVLVGIGLMITILKKKKHKSEA